MATGLIEWQKLSPDRFKIRFRGAGFFHLYPLIHALCLELDPDTRIILHNVDQLLTVTVRARTLQCDLDPTLIQDPDEAVERLFSAQINHA